VAVAYVSDAPPNWGLLNNALDVILRAGRSAERRIPTLVLIPPPMPLPAPAADAMFVSCPLSDKEALKLHLWAFFAPILAAERPTQIAPTVPVYLDTNLTLTELHRLSDEQPGLAMRVEQLANNLLHQAGANVAAAQVRRSDEGHADRVDFAITPSDDAQNVVLIEVKAGRLTEDRLAHAEQQLRRYVMDRKASLGMVLYHDSTGRTFPPRRTVPRVIRLSLEELAERLESHSLTKIMSDAVAETIGKAKK